MTNRCPVSEAELKHDGGGTMTNAEYARRWNEALENDNVVLLIWEALFELSAEDQKTIVRLMFADGNGQDLMEAARMLYMKSSARVASIVSEEIYFGD